MPENTKNKVKYDLKNVHWAKTTLGENNAPTFGTVKPWPGAVSLSLDAEGEPTNFYADGIAYYVINNNNGYSGDLESAMVPDDFRKEILGDVADAKDIILEDADAQLAHFALLFEFEGDIRKIKHVLYNCVASRPSVQSQTKEEDVEVQTETISIDAKSVYFSSVGKNIVKAKTSDNSDATAVEGWYTSVYEPTPSA
jgi:phi13 family phage major tail protein